MSPLVSVVIPTFNRRDQVLQALESIANQSYPHLETIVADDASTDDTSDTWTLVALIGRLAHPDVREWAYTTRAALNRRPS